MHWSVWSVQHSGKRLRDCNFKPPLEPLPWQSGHSESTLQHVLEPECAEDGIGASSCSHEAGFTDQISRTNARIQGNQSIDPESCKLEWRVPQRFHRC
jgi:hypothetical protein